VQRQSDGILQQRSLHMPSIKAPPLLGKSLTLAGIVVLLTMLISSIQGVIHDRQRAENETVHSVQSAVANAQTIVGPILYQSCTEKWVAITPQEKKLPLKEDRTRTFNRLLTPTTLNATSTVDVEQRGRSLYRTQVLQTKMQLKAQFAPVNDYDALRTEKNSTLSCNENAIALDVSDPRGVRVAIAKVNGAEQPIAGGVLHSQNKRGMHTLVNTDSLAKTEGFSVEWVLDFVGTERIGVAPIGDKSEINLTSPWPHPSFVGRLAPAERTITAEGFKAHWKLSSVATDAAAAARDDGSLCEPHAQRHAQADKTRCIEAAYVEFVNPINVYSLSDRATKYGLLFVVFTFVAVGMVEVMKRLRVHPMQYLLVGAALSVFFLLLVSLSEHIGFDFAYLAASAATTLLLTYYAVHILRGLRAGLGFGAMIALLYGLLFMLLQLEQTALVVGAIAIFAVLAAVVIATRKLDWYALFASNQSPAAEGGRDADEHRVNAV
jgi:inner membrane protein